MPSPPPEIRLVVFDWAGTTIDFGSYAPVAAFSQVFAARGIEVAAREARGPMGMHKKDHLRVMLQTPAIRQRWRDRHGRDWSETDLEAMYQELTPLQLATIAQHSALAPGLLECVAALRSRGIRLGGATGYFPAAAERCAALAKQQGYEPDANVCGDDVPAGRPAPWMIFRLMQQLNVYPPSVVLKVGDTVVDVEEGRNAGVWSIAVSSSSSEMGLTETEYNALSVEEKKIRMAAVAGRFHDAGAHGVIESLYDLPGFVDELNARIRRGAFPINP